MPRVSALARRALVAAVVLLASAAPVAGASSDAQVGGVVASLEQFPAAPVAPGDEFALTVEVDNLGSAPLDDAAVSVALTREPLRDVAAVASFLDGADAAVRTVARSGVGAVITPADASEPSTRLGGGAATEVEAVAGADALALPDDAWGVYGVVVRLESGGVGTTIDRGTLTWAGLDVPALRVATVAVAAGEATRVRAVAAAADVPGATLALDATVLGQVGVASMGLGARDAFRLPSMHPDLVSLAHGEDDELLPYALERSRGTAAGATADLPWLAVTTVLDRATIAYALANGASAVLLDGDAAAAAGTGDALRSVAVTAGEMPVAVPDATLSATAREAGVTSPARAVAEAALLAGEGAGTVVVSPGTTWVPSGSAPTVLAALADAPFVTPVRLSTLLAEGPTGVLGGPRFADRAGDLSAATLAALASRLDRVRDLAVAAESPAAVLDPSGGALLAPLATAFRAAPDTRRLRVDDAVQTVDATLGGLRVAAGSEINLIAARGSVPVTVRNDLAVDATVSVDITSFSPNLQIRDMPTVTLAAGTTETVLVEVEGISSANVVTRIVLRNPAGDIIGDAVTMSVRVRADWGTAVTAFFTAGLVLLLVMGVIRTIRRGRKETRTGPRASPSSEVPVPGDDDRVTG